MTNQQQEPFAPAPPLFYWTLHLERAADRAKARERGEERAVDEFIAQVNKAADLIARKNPDPRKRAEAYRNKPAQDWAEQFLYFVNDCAEDWADWERIAPEDESLRETVVGQIEELLSLAGIDLQDENLHGAAAKMERYLGDLRTVEPAPAISAGGGSGGNGGSEPVSGPVYP